MDKNSIIGLSIIGLLIVGYSIFTQPSKEELAAARHKQDSIAALQVQEKAMDTIQQTAVVPVNATDSSLIIPNDSILAHNEKQQFGDFYEAANGTEQLLTLENTKIKVEISSKGGRIRAIELKDYKSWQGNPVRLFLLIRVYSILHCLHKTGLSILRHSSFRLPEVMETRKA